MKTSNFSIDVSFTVPDEFNSPGYWDLFEGEALASYEGPEVSEEEILKLISEGDFSKFEIDEEVEDGLGYHLNLEELSKIAKECKTIKEFEEKSSEVLFESFKDELLEVSDILDDGEDTVEELRSSYEVSIYIPDLN